jgi:hypothetical protein
VGIFRSIRENEIPQPLETKGCGIMGGGYEIRISIDIAAFISIIAKATLFGDSIILHW